MRKAVFLDRDGTINIDHGYTYRLEDLELFRGSSQAISLLNDAGYLVIVVTNQAGIARGYFTRAEAEAFNNALQRELLAQGSRIDAFYYCPHHPEGHPPYNIICNCRKPAPGMLLKAQEDWKIDFRSSWVIGDKWSDLQAGITVGCKPLLVLTGNGKDEAEYVPKVIPRCIDLLAAARIILGGSCVIK